MAGVFLLIAVIGAAASALARDRTRQRAILERAARAQGATALIDPKVLSVAMQAGRALGWQRLIPLALLGFLAAQWVQGSAARRHHPTGLYDGLIATRSGRECRPLCPSTLARGSRSTPQESLGGPWGARHSYCIAADKQRNSSLPSELNRRNKQMKSPAAIQRRRPAALA